MLKKSLIYIAIVCLIGLSLVTLLGFFGNLHWIADLFAHFRFQYIWIAFLLGALAAAQKLWPWVGIAGTIVLLNLFVVVNFSVTPDSTGQNQLRVYFANIYIHNEDVKTITQSIRAANPDVAIIAEIDEDLFTQLQQQLPDYPHTAHRMALQTFGIAIFSKRAPSSDITFHYFGDSALPSIEAQFTEGDRDVSVIGTHAIPPLSAYNWQWRNEHVVGAAEYANAAGSTLLVGDFNLTSYSPVFRRLLKDYALTENHIGASWPAFLPRFGFRIPIDHALTAGDATVIHTEQGEATGSDHLPIIVDVVY